MIKIVVGGQMDKQRIEKKLLINIAMVKWKLL